MALYQPHKAAARRGPLMRVYPYLGDPMSWSPTPSDRLCPPTFEPLGGTTDSLPDDLGCLACRWKTLKLHRLFIRNGG